MPISEPTDHRRDLTDREPRWRALAAAGFAGLLLLSGCGEDAVSDGRAPEADGEPPQDPQPQDNEQDAPNVEDPDLSGDEEPGLTEGFQEDTEEQD